MYKILIFALLLGCFQTQAQRYLLQKSSVSKSGTMASNYTLEQGFGYDFNTIQDGLHPFFFSVKLPEGAYKLKLTLGNDSVRSVVSVKSESRRWMLHEIEIPTGKTVEKEIVVHVRNRYIGNQDSVRINPREIGKLIWDEKLTLEFNGSHPSVKEIKIEPVRNLPTLYLAGNSTVVDEGQEPWCGWGQVLPMYLNNQIVVANFAESGQAANTFVSSKRLDKILTEIKKGDFLLIEFGHNDQKQKGEGKGPFLSFTEDLRFLVHAAQNAGAMPILVSPMHRRFFDENGKVKNTHGDYPEAVRQLAQQEGVFFIDLHAMSAKLYEAWGPEDSKKAFVHYPAGTFPNQDKALEDNTHFNTYGASQIARCILKGIIDGNLPLKKYIKKEFRGFDPQKPEEMMSFPATPFYSLDKPLGN